MEGIRKEKFRSLCPLVFSGYNVLVKVGQVLLLGFVSKLYVEKWSLGVGVLLEGWSSTAAIFTAVIQRGKSWKAASFWSPILADRSAAARDDVVFCCCCIFLMGHLMIQELLLWFLVLF